MSDFLNWELTNRMHNLGYDGKTLVYIDNEEDIINDDSAELIGAKPAILTSAAFRWFREKYGLHYQIEYMDDVLQYGYVITEISINTELEEKYKFTYEEAELACLKKLIEIVQGGNNE